MLKTEETTATEVWLHAVDHGDRPVIHGAEIDYDDVHAGVRYHADLLEAARKRSAMAHNAYDQAAVTLAIGVDYAERDGADPRTWGSFADHLAAFRAADAEERAAHRSLMAMYAKRDQDAAFKTYAVSA